MTSPIPSSTTPGVGAIVAKRALVRYRTADGGAAYGILEDGTIYEASEPLSFEAEIGAAVGAYGEVPLLAPCEPSTVVGVARNVRWWYEQTGEAPPERPIFWIKATRCLVNPGDEVTWPPYAENLVPEAEIAIVMKKDAYRITPEQVADHILGITGSNDVTVVGMEDKYEYINKQFDTSLPLGPAIVPYTSRIAYTCHVDDELVQQGSTDDYVFPIERLVADASQVRTLERGDVMICGASPSVHGGTQMIRAVGETARRGQLMICQIEGTGVLENRLV